MTGYRKKMITATICLALAAAFVLSSCGNQQAAPSVTETPETTSITAEPPASSENTAESAAAEAVTDEQPVTESEQPSWYADEGLVGSPWPTSILKGNITAERPDRNDDIFMYYNYDRLKYGPADDYIAGENEIYDIDTEFARCIRELIADESKTSHDLEQLRIMYSMIADEEYMKSVGSSEIKPYIERIQAVSSIEEMNALLTSTDFPFSPFIEPILRTKDRLSPVGVLVYPNHIFLDYDEGRYYFDTDDPSSKVLIQHGLRNEKIRLESDRDILGITEEDVETVAQKLLDFEISYGKHEIVDLGIDINRREEYGSMSKLSESNILTVDELAELCPAFPIKGILANQKKDTASMYFVSSSEWLPALNSLWTEENLDTIKLIAEAVILKETIWMRDISEYNNIYIKNGEAPSAQTYAAYAVCDKNKTFSHLLAKLYVSEVIGENGVKRITELTRDILNTYKKLINETTWIEDDTREAIESKLDNMGLNILEPDSGYFDYSDLELIPADKGGTPLANYLMIRKQVIEQEYKQICSDIHGMTLWSERSPTMKNAFYYTILNNINILPGYLNNTIYRDDMTKEELMGGLGLTIAHEISHAFDYQGSQYDGMGRAIPVFCGEDIDDYLKLTKRLSEYYDTIEIEPDKYVDGQNVAVEAFADLSGIYAVLTLAEDYSDCDFEKVIAACTNAFCRKIGEDTLAIYFSDPHPIDNIRINVSLQMCDIMYEKFGIKEGDGMYLEPEKRIVIWGKDAA